MTPVDGWQEHARCRLTDTPDDWFPDGRTLSQANRRALAVCEGCPVRRLCAASAQPGDVGIWGGEVHWDRASRRSTMIPAQRTRSELLELTARGWTLGDLARAADSTEHTLGRVRRGAKVTLRPELAQAVHRAYLRLRTATCPRTVVPTVQDAFGPAKAEWERNNRGAREGASSVRDTSRAGTERLAR